MAYLGEQYNNRRRDSVRGLLNSRVAGGTIPTSDDPVSLCSAGNNCISRQSKLRFSLDGEVVLSTCHRVSSDGENINRS